MLAPRLLSLEERALHAGGVFHEQRRHAVDAGAGEIVAAGEASELVAQERLLVAQTRRVASRCGAFVNSGVTAHGCLLWAWRGRSGLGYRSRIDLLL
jgi:hypothetical protein